MQIENLLSDKEVLENNITKIIRDFLISYPEVTMELRLDRVEMVLSNKCGSENFKKYKTKISVLL